MYASTPLNLVAALECILFEPIHGNMITVPIIG